MRLDHLAYAAGPDGIERTSQRFAALLGEDFVDGGIHPRFGTRNMVLPLDAGTYLEIVAVLDHPASDKATFGQSVRIRSDAGGGWLGWVIAVDDMAAHEARLGRTALRGSRHRPDGVELMWRQIGIENLKEDPQLPFFLHWEVAPEQHPSCGASGAIALTKLEIAGDPARVGDWLDQDPAKPLENIEVEWVAPGSSTGILAATFETPGGRVRI